MRPVVADHFLVIAMEIVQLKDDIMQPMLQNDKTASGRPRGFDESDVVNTAMVAFWSSGFAGTTIDELEKATGVDVIIDDTPGVVIVSAFDMIRREVARISLNKLILSRLTTATVDSRVSCCRRQGWQGGFENSFRPRPEPICL